MSDEFPGALNKGARVFARRLGKADVEGRVTWVGPNRFGDDPLNPGAGDGGYGTYGGEGLTGSSVPPVPRD